MLDFIRYGENLPGTKIGCREGDCGACTVLEGSIESNQIQYKSIVSCLTPLGNAHGKHIVTIEGVNLNDLSPVQHAMIDHSATQCGFCTPGFIMSFTGFAMQKEQSEYEKAIASISGNICRCTGYKSIERAAASITLLMQNKDIKNPISWMVENEFLPEYFLLIPDRLKQLPAFGPFSDRPETQIKDYDAMLDEYYLERGWDQETGIPTADTLRALNLDTHLARL